MTTEIALHPHVDVGWVSWRRGPAGFTRIHLTRPGSERTLCDSRIPSIPGARVVRNQFSAAIEDLCLNCLRVFSQERK